MLSGPDWLNYTHCLDLIIAQIWFLQDNFRNVLKPKFSSGLFLEEEITSCWRALLFDEATLADNWDSSRFAWLSWFKLTFGFIVNNTQLLFWKQWAVTKLSKKLTDQTVKYNIWPVQRIRTLESEDYISIKLVKRLGLSNIKEESWLVAWEFEFGVDHCLNVCSCVKYPSSTTSTGASNNSQFAPGRRRTLL